MCEGVRVGGGRGEREWKKGGGKGKERQCVCALELNNRDRSLPILCVSEAHETVFT